MSNNKNTDIEQKRDPKKPATCASCLHAALHRYDNNPLLAACHQKPQPDNERFPFEVEIASTPRKCAEYKYDPNEKTIEQRTRRHSA